MGADDNFAILVVKMEKADVYMLSTYTVYDTLLRSRGHEVGCHPFDSQLIAVEKHGCYQGLLGGG